MKRVMIAGLMAVTAIALSSCASHEHTRAGAGVGNNGGGVPLTPAGPSVSWPIRFESNGTDFTVFEPQADSWDGRNLTGRCAVAMQGPRELTANYGVFGFSAITLVDKSAGTVKLANFRVTSADFPSNRNQTQNYVAALAQEFPKQAPTLAIDRLQGNLSVVAPPRLDHLNNVPPKIIIATTPAVLVYIDGPPALRPVPGTDLQRVINTRLLVLHDSSGHFYLHVFDGYLQAEVITGPWKVATQIPVGVTVAEQQAADSGEIDLMPGTPDPVTQKKPSLKTSPVPRVLVATTPTELIQFRGPIEYVAIPGTDLLYAANTSGNVFKSVRDQQNYVLISGRWYRSASLDGPWRFVPGNKLPRDFANIPDDSPKENVKASVPGTLQAQEALVANGIPESTAVARTNELATPQFDGAMQLAPIEETPLYYVVNSATPIIKVGPQSWYACDNGVWYHASSANGPWTVATSVPPVIYTIPPSSPLHYLTYVQVYGSNPETVYEGYTPGYLGTEVADDGTVVYGTGYDYNPWIGSVWYGPPVTYGWGFADCWTPWWGWGYGWGFGPNWGWGGYFPPRPWWGGFGNWHHHAGDGWWQGADHGVWANTDARVYSQSRQLARRSDLNGYGAAYNSRTGWLQAGQEARFRSVAGRNFAYNKNLIAPRFNDLIRSYQINSRGAWYGGRYWPEIPGNALQGGAGAPHGIIVAPEPRGENHGGEPRGGGFRGGGGHGRGGGGHR